MKLRFMLNNKEFNVTPLVEAFVYSWNSTTKRHEPSKELFLSLFDHDSATLLTNIDEDYLLELIEQGLDDVYHTHWMNAQEEMRCIVEDAVAEFSSLY